MPVTQTQTCVRCQQAKPYKAFRPGGIGRPSWCIACARTSNGDGAQMLTWPRSSVTIGCPHCTSQVGWRSMTCCVCDGTRVLSVHRLDVASNVWARPRCACDACVGAGPMPGSEPIRSEPIPEPARVLRGPFNSFRESFAHRPRAYVEQAS